MDFFYSLYLRTCIWYHGNMEAVTETNFEGQFCAFGEWSSTSCGSCCGTSCSVVSSCCSACFCSPTALSLQGSRVSHVGSGYGCCIYGLGQLAALIRQHKRGRIESLMTRGIFHRSLHLPHSPAPFKVRTLFSPLLQPVKELIEDRQVFPNCPPPPTHPHHPIHSRGRFKGHATRNSRITRLTK